jgi:hypothetical protein
MSMPNIIGSESSRQSAGTVRSASIKLRAIEDGNAISGFVMPRHLQISSIAQIISISLSNQIQLSDSELGEVRKGAKLAAP